MTMESNIFDRVPRRCVSGKCVKALLALAILVFSVVMGFRYDPTPVIAELKGQQMRASAVTAAAATASVTISLIPDDIGGSVADEIDDVTGWMIVATSCIMLERFIAALAGTVSYWFLIPLSCVLYLLYVFRNSARARHIAVRLLCMGLSLLLVIPMSLKIDECFDMVLDSDAVFEELEQMQTESETEHTEESLWQKAGDLVSGTINSLKDIKGTVQNLTIRIMDSIAIMLITTLVVPILCILLLWLISKSVIKSILQIVSQDVLNDAKAGIDFVHKTAKNARPNIRSHLRSRNDDDCEE